MSSQEEGRGEVVQDQGAPLTAEEKRLVNRLFSEPLEFPTIFRNWLKNFIETAGIVLPKSSIATGAGGGSGSLAGLPAGMIFARAGSTVPSGSLPCNGMAVSRTEYKALFDEIGTSWGAGDGSTTFNVPDLRDRTLFGAGSKVALGQTDGGALGVRGPTHHHPVSIPNSSSGYNTLGGETDWEGDHSHGYDRAYGVALNIQNNADSPANVVGVTGGGTGGGGGHNHGVTVGGTVNVSGTVNGNTAGGGTPNAPGYAGINYVITT